MEATGSTSAKDDPPGELHDISTSGGREYEIRLAVAGSLQEVARLGYLVPAWVVFVEEEVVSLEALVETGRLMRSLDDRDDTGVSRGVNEVEADR